MKKSVFYLGNPLLKADNLQIRLIWDLKKLFPNLSFIHFDPTEEFPEKNPENLILIDTVIGIEKVTCFNDLNQWSISPRNTVHDFDLPVSLGLLQKLGKLKKVTIIGVPAKGPKSKVVEEIVELMSKLSWIPKKNG